MPTCSRSVSLQAVCLAAALAFVPATTARALLHSETPSGANEWSAFEGGRARLLAHRESDGAAAVLEVELEPGWKTYWRAPGPSGIAPVFDAENSSNATITAVGYPAPESFSDVYGESVGYRDAVAFPLTIAIPDRDRPAKLALDATIGVCAELCVPVSLRFAAALDASVPEAGKRIEAARLALPVSGEPLEATLANGALTVRGDAIGADGEAFVAPPEGTTLEAIRLDPGVLRTRLLRGDGRGEWRVVVRSGSGPFARVSEHELRIAP